MLTGHLGLFSEAAKNNGTKLRIAYRDWELGGAWGNRESSFSAGLSCLSGCSDTNILWLKISIFGHCMIRNITHSREFGQAF